MSLFAASGLNTYNRNESISSNKTLVCNVCQELQRCDRCMLWQKLSAFRTAQGSRLDTCKQCMTTPYAGRGETKATDQFTQLNMNIFLRNSQTVCCNSCITEGKTPTSGGYRLNAKMLTVCSVWSIAKPAFSQFHLVAGT